MSKNHGQLQPAPPPPRKAPPRIPRSLQGGVIECHSGFMNYEKSCSRYGLWLVRCLIPEKDFFGTILKEGETCKVPGNIALESALYGEIEFCDPRADEEDRAAAEAARLSIPIPASKNPAFAGR